MTFVEYSYTFNVVINAPVDALDWLERRIEEWNNESASDPPDLVRDKDEPTMLRVWAQSDCDIEGLAELVCEMQKEFGLTEPLTLKYRIVRWDDEEEISWYAAFVCYRGSAHSLNYAEEVPDTIAKLLKGEGESEQESD